MQHDLFTSVIWTDFLLAYVVHVAQGVYEYCYGFQPGDVSVHAASFETSSYSAVLLSPEPRTF